MFDSSIQRIREWIQKIAGPCLAPILHIGNRKLRIVRLIAEGGYSYVYLVRDCRSNEELAVKKILVQTREEDLNVRNEIGVHKSLDHPNLLQLLDFTMVQTARYQEAFLLFPAYPRGTLYEYVSKVQLTSDTSLDEKSAIMYFRQIVSGIHAMHSNDPPYAHRDLKPQNVLLSDEDTAVVVDFGSAAPAKIFIDSRQKGLELQEKAEQHSSMAYRAPELYDVQTNTTVTEKSDIWSLGCILFSLFYKGMSPFECQFDVSGKPYVVDDVGYLRVISGVKYPEHCSLSARMKSLIGTMLQVDPTLRPSAAEVMQYLDDHILDFNGSTISVSVV